MWFSVCGPFGMPTVRNVAPPLLTLAFCAELLLFRRPWFAASQMLVLQGVVLSVSAVKNKALQEPFVFQDVEYFVDMLRHPRLYLPFFGLFKLVLILGGVALMIGLSLQLEPSLLDCIGTTAFAEGWLLLTTCAAALLWLSTRGAFGASRRSNRSRRERRCGGRYRAPADRGRPTICRGHPPW